MADRRRCTVKEHNNPDNSKVLLVPARADLAQFLQLASEKLKIDGRTLFLEDGGQIDDMALIRDNDVIFVSCGEPFNQACKSSQAVGRCCGPLLVASHGLVCSV